MASVVGPLVGSGEDELRRLQELDQRLWSPRHRRHPGQLAWSVGSVDPAGREAGPAALWFEDDRVVAWAWAEDSRWLEVCVDPRHPELADAAVDWFVEDVARSGTPASVMIMDDDAVVAATLTRHGFAPQPQAPYFSHLVLDLAQLPPVPTVPGYALRSVSPGEEAPRAACHRGAWSAGGESQVTAAAYRRLVTLWPYRHDLDWVAVASDEPDSDEPDSDEPDSDEAGSGEPGEMVASCLLWYDERNQAVLLEPVGCVPALRRRGLARAVSIAALQAARVAGATTALVCPRGDAGYPVPAHLYRSMGFARVGRTQTWQRDR